MSTNGPDRLDRRGALRLLGGGIAVVTVGGLAGCGGDEPAPKPAATPAATPQPDPAGQAAEAAPDAAAEAPADTAQEPAQAAAAEPTRIEESDPQAETLGYRHDAANVDTTKFAGYEPGEACANCALYAGGADDAWAPCPIFRNQLVNANGWCSAYVAKPQA